MLHPNSSKSYHILSSSGQSKYSMLGGVVVYIASGKLNIKFRSKVDLKVWKALDIAVVANEWFQLAATWYKYGDLTICVNGSRRMVANKKSYSSGGFDVPSFMYVEKTHNGEICCQVIVDEWYFWDYMLDDTAVNILYNMF